MLTKYVSWIDYKKIRSFVVAEYSVLIGLAIATALIWAFVGLADEVSEGDTHVVDTAILQIFRSQDDPSQMIGSFWFQEAIRDITSLGSFSLLTIILVFVVLLLAIRKQVAEAALVAVAVISGTIISQFLKGFFERSRPEFSSIAEQLSASFPSGHAMLSAVTYLTIGALLARFTSRLRLKIFFFAAAIILTVMVGVSRVILGVHYPSDVVAGWALGAGWALICSTVTFFLQERGQVKSDGLKGETTED